MYKRHRRKILADCVRACSLRSRSGCARHILNALALPSVMQSGGLGHTATALVQAALTGQLVAAVLGRRADKRYDDESMALSAELLRRNPEVYTVWNYRCVSVPVLHHCASIVSLHNRHCHVKCHTWRWQTKGCASCVKGCRLEALGIVGERKPSNNAARAVVAGELAVISKL